MVFQHNVEDLMKHEKNFLVRREQINHYLKTRKNIKAETDFSSLAKTILCEKYGYQRNHRNMFLNDMGLSDDSKDRHDESIYRQFICNKTKDVSISKEQLLRICTRIVDNRYDAFFLFFYAGKNIFSDVLSGYFSILNDFYDLDIVGMDSKKRYEVLSALLKCKHYKGIGPYL